MLYSVVPARSKFLDSKKKKKKKQPCNLTAFYTNFATEFFHTVFTRRSVLRPAGSDPEVVCQKDSFLKVSVSLGGFGPSVAHGKHSVRRRCVQATKNKAETCSLHDAIGRRSCGR